jgi:hypothetical protein
MMYSLVLRTAAAWNPPNGANQRLCRTAAQPEPTNGSHSSLNHQMEANLLPNIMFVYSNVTMHSLAQAAAAPVPWSAGADIPASGTFLHGTTGSLMQRLPVSIMHKAHPVLFREGCQFIPGWPKCSHRSGCRRLMASTLLSRELVTQSPRVKYKSSW